jgi:molecular chaperone DnaK (HSP70)
MSKNKTRVAVNAGSGKNVSKEKVATGQASVGVDFGTTKISIAAFKPDINTFEIIVNEDGERATPCFVGYTDSERIIGTPAKTAVARNIENTIHSFRDALNLSFSDLPTKHKTFGVTVSADQANKAQYEVKFKAEATVVTPDDLITTLFEKVKAHADGYWDENVKTLVMSVPPNFSPEARAAMTACAEKAGFSVQAILAEPLAAAVSFGLDDDKAADAAVKKNVLVVDVGSHSTTLSVLTSQHGLLSLVDSDATADVGATHVDDHLFTHFSKVFTTKFQLDLSESQRATTRLKLACENVKKSLSTMPAASVKLDSLFEGQDLFADVTRARMEMMCDTLFRALHNALLAFFKRPHNVRAGAITHIILAGGGSALPRIQAIVEDFFAEQTGALTATVLKQQHPSEAAVFGCAKQASLLAGVSAEVMAERSAAARALKDKIAAAGITAVSTADAGKPTFATVTNEAYSAPIFALAKPVVAKIASGAFVPVLAAGTPVPCSVTIPFTVPTSASAAALRLFEAQSATEFAPLAAAALPAPAGGAGVLVRVAVDAAHTLTISAAAAPAAGKKARSSDFKTIATSSLSNELVPTSTTAAAAAPAESAPFAAQQTAAAHVLLISQQWARWKQANGVTAATALPYLQAAVADADARVKAGMSSAIVAADKLPAVAALTAALSEIQEAVAAVLVLKKKGPVVAAQEAAAKAAEAKRMKEMFPDSDDDDEEEAAAPAAGKAAAPESDDDDDDDDDDDMDFDMGGGLD